MPFPSTATVSTTGTPIIFESFSISIMIPFLLASSAIFKTSVKGSPSSDNSEDIINPL